MPQQEVTTISLFTALGWKLIWSLKALGNWLGMGIGVPIVMTYVLVTYYGKTDSTHFNETKTLPMNFKVILNSTVGTLDLLYTGNGETDIVMKTVEKMIPARKVVKKKDADEMHHWFMQNHQNISDRIVGIGIIFEKMTKTELIYTMRATPIAFLNTDKQYPEQSAPGPVYAGSFYFQNFFIPVQIAINTGYMDYIGLNKTEWFLQEFPFPPYETSGFERYDSNFMLILLGFFILKVYMLDVITKEKSSGTRELLFLNGFKRYMIHVYWILLFTFCYLTVSICVAFILIGAFKRTSFLLLFLLFFVYSIADILLVLFIGEIFKSNTIAMPVYTMISMGVIYFKKIVKESCFSFIMMLIMLIPTAAVDHGLELMKNFEIKGDGMTTKNMMKVEKSSGRGPYLLLIIEMIISTIIYFLMTSYICAIIPGEFGAAKPWHYIIPNVIKKPFMKGKKQKIITHTLGPTPVIENVKMEPGIKVKNLYKTYGAFNAVNNLSIDLYKNQITVLLGHNGAGKSTFFYMITGIKSPTSGEIFYEGENIFDNIAKFRQSIGFCPQTDISIDCLTVQNQIMFFGLAKGLNIQKAKRDSILIMKKLGFIDKQNELPTKLSGGMRRKLNLAIALTNNPLILFFDEPTSGLDPESRRNLWNILLTLREGRTIIITTHFMEEADVLGDKIAIMAHGEIRCYGSAMFLKKHYGSGYKLTISYQDESPTALQETVTNFTSGVLESSKGNKLIFNIPIEDTPKLSKMFLTLEGYLSNKSNISVVCNSSEDIFLKFGALIKKRILCYHIEWFNFLSNIFIIIFGTVVVMGFVKQQVKTNLPKLDLELDNYKDTTVIISGNPENKVFSAFKSIVGASGASMSIVQNNVSDELAKVGLNSDFEQYTDNYMIAGDFLKIPTVFYSTVCYHGPAIAVNVLFNSLIQSVRPKVYIKTANQPYEFKSTACSTNVITQILLPIGWCIFIFTFLTSISFFVMFPLVEKRSKFKHLQYMSGLHPIVYWLANFLYDVILFSISFLLIIGLIAYFMDNTNYFREELFATIMVSTFLIGAAMILVCYLTSLTTNNVTIAMLVITYSLFIMMVAVFVIDYFMPMGKSIYAFYINPSLPYFLILLSITEKGSRRFMCSECTIEESECYGASESIFSNETVKINICILLLDILIFFILLILFDLKLFFCVNYFEAKPKKDDIKLEDEDVLQERQVVKNHYEKLIAVKIKEKKDRISNISLPASNISDMTQESVKTSIKEKEETENIVLLVDSLSKYYKKDGEPFTACENISFVGVRGECFVVLGASGAGKSTLFGMLTGTILPKSGDALIVTDQKTHRLKWILSFIKNIGYCPQDNWILGSMTARQLLVHFAHLRGVKNEEITEIVNWWIKMLDLHLYCDKSFDKYSGGNKRKLSTALALIGEPPVILLDEPTTGVDPVTRRKLWQVFKLIENTDQTMILTSHSMDECEAVCNRVTILKQGRMQCIGDVQYLKNRFALGYTIFIKLSENTDVQSLKKQIVLNFGSKCVLIDQHAALLHYHVNEIKFKWSQIFSKMDIIENSFGCEYMLSDTTLEQVFMSFVNK